MKMQTILFFILFFIPLSVTLAGEKSVYNFNWLDKDKEIYVLQNRVYRKDGRLYVGLSGAKTISGAFVDSYGAQAKLGYFLTEDWGVEFTYAKNSGSENDVAKGVSEQGSIPFYRKVDSYMGGMLMWSPFYAKINTFNQIFYFDWILGAGLANVTTLDNREKFTVPPSNTLTSESSMGGMWTSAFRFHLSQNWSLRFDFTGLHYKADRVRKVGSTDKKTSAVFSNYDVALGINFAL